jgi:hypothetical protein
MKTTLYLEPVLLKQVKQCALTDGITFTEFTQNALKLALARRDQLKMRKPVKIPTFGGQGLLPGVDISNNAGLLDAMGDEPD